MISHLPGSSFIEYLAQSAPQLLPTAAAPSSGGQAPVQAPHGTTIVAAAYAGGVAIAGDRRATMGNIIASDGIEKVFVTDRAGALGIAGTAGLAMEVVRLFSVELEHFEKIEGVRLSLAGRANRLATMLRGQLPLAMQGLAVLPLYVGFDESNAQGRIYSYDVTGGCYEERDYHAIGSGALFARGSLKNRWSPGLTSHEALRTLVDALCDAADDDSATGGPDITRRIWPTCALVEASGAHMVTDDVLTPIINEAVAQRQARWETRR